MTTDDRPSGITVIAVVMIAVAALDLLMLVPAMLRGGLTAYRVGAVVRELLFSACSIWAALGLLALRPAARVWAMVLLGLQATNAVWGLAKGSPLLGLVAGLVVFAAPAALAIVYLSRQRDLFEPV